MALNKPLTLESSLNILCTECGDFNRKGAKWLPENKFKINFSNFAKNKSESCCKQF